MARAGEGLLSTMSDSIRGILESAKRMAEMNVFIGDVADRTNLLGMNASIEAAHAGQVGKGFAVVADQIRALSVEAANSSRVISETLRDTQSAVENAAAKNQEALDFFRRIQSEIDGVSGLLEELLANLRELSAGSDDVLRAVGAVAELTNATEKVVAASRSSIAQSSEGIASVVSIAKTVHEESSQMPVRLDDVSRDLAEVERLGGENLRTVQGLKESLEHFGADAQG
jgi:methyl-accepting chemotaxis protein